MSWRDPDHLPLPLTSIGNHYDWIEAQPCIACDGSGLDADSGDSPHEQMACGRCDGSGEEPEEA